MKNPSNAFENNQVLVNIKGVGIEPEYKGVPTSILDGKYSTPEKTDFSGTEPEKVDFADTAPRHDRFPVPESREFKSLVTAQNNSKTVEELLDTLRAYTEIPLKSLSNEGKDTDFLLGDFLAEFISGEINKAKTVQGVDLNFKIKGLPQFNDQLQRLLTEQKNFTQSPLGNPTQDVNVFSHDRRGAGEKAVFRASLNLPQSKTVAPIESGFLRPSEGTFGGERDLLGTKQRNGTLTPDEYFREMGKIDEKEDENKRVSNVKQPPIVTRFIARLKNFFSGVPTKSPFTSESEQPEPTMDTLTTRETPLLTHSTNNAKESNYELAKKAPDISDAKINIKYVKYPATPTGIHNPDNQVTSNTQYPLSNRAKVFQDFL